MAWADRGYYEQGGRRRLFGGGGFGGAFGGRFDGARMTVWLLAINFIVFTIDSILADGTRVHEPFLAEWGYFSLDLAVYRFQIWRFFTYQFLHSGFWHLFWNMLGLFFFAPLVERWWGSRRFLVFYLLCGASGALMMPLLSPLVHNAASTGLVGASGSLFGILVAAAVVAPDMRVMLLFPPIPVSMRTLALVFLGFAVFKLLAGTANAGGEAAHLGGALMGFILTKRPRVLNFIDPGAAAYGVGPRRTGWRDRLARRRREKQAKREAAEQVEVDRILAKVHEHGMHSLNEREKRTLKRATDRQRRAG